MGEEFVVLADGGDDVAFHDLHVVDVVEQAEVPRTQPLAQRDAPFGVIAQVIVVIHLGIQQFHHQHHAALLGVAEDALQPRFGVGQPLLGIHAVAIAGEADEVAVAGIGHQVDVAGVARHQLVVELGSGETLHQVDLRAIAHRAEHAMRLQRRPVVRPDQIDGGEADVLHRLAELRDRQVRERPAGDRLLQATLERERFLGGETGGHHTGRRQPEATHHRRAQGASSCELRVQRAHPGVLAPPKKVCSDESFEASPPREAHRPPMRRTGPIE